MIRTQRARGLLLCAGLGLATAGTLPLHARAEGLDGAPARSLSEEWASQFWDLTARFDSGHQLFVRFAVSNVGLGDRNGAASWQIVSPRGRVLEFHNGRRRPRWSLSPDGLRLEMGSSLLDQHGPSQRLRLDKHPVQLDLHFSARAPPLEVDALHDLYGTRLLALAAPVSGRLWLEGMDSQLAVRGEIAVTYTWMRERESRLQARRVEFFSLGPERPIYLLDIETPEGEHRQCQVIRDAGGTLRRVAPARLCACAGPASRDGYPLPQALELGGGSIDGRIEIARILVRYDPLMPLPRVFRWLLRAVLRPLRIWAESPYDIALQPLGKPEVRLRGTGITVVGFSNPLPEGSSTPPQGSTRACECVSVS
ncbi:MAG: hypothetical protein ACE5IL_09910 [Myxococcota bacterium]